MSSTTARIDPTARVAQGARLGENVEIGPFCTVGPDVELGDGVRLLSHVVVEGHTTLGAGTAVYPFAVLGTPPQSLHYKGEPSRLVVGRNCIVREHVTMNIGTAGGHMETRVGDNGMFMAASHVAHDCVVGNNVIFANNATLAGHVTVGDNVFLGGLTAVHQFARVGEGAIIGGMCGARHDIIPFGAMVEGRPGLGGLNIIGLKRRGATRADIHALRAAYRELFYGRGTLVERTARTAELFAGQPYVTIVLDFIRSAGKRRLTVPHDVDDGGDREAA